MFFGFLFLGWILSLFGFDDMLIEVLQPFVSFPLTTSHYYVGLFFLGLFFELLEYIFRG